MILYTISKNAVDSTHCNEIETNQIRYSTINHSSHVDFIIFCNGKQIKDETTLFEPLFTTKVDYCEECDNDDPKGAGLDLYFLKMILDKLGSMFLDEKNVASHARTPSEKPR